MPDLVKHSLCTGCTACVSVCPTQCLKMDFDKEGFAFPQILNIEKCISCHKCEQVCPVLNIKKINSQVKIFAAFSQNEDIRTESSSGGIFSEIALKILGDDGCVYGAAYMEDGNVKHICVEKSEQLGKIRGAKYAQSDLNNCFYQIKRQLESGKKILFSGTPCQVEGLNAFLGKGYANLLCIDFVCHGVPSSKAWVNYVRWRAEQDNQGILPQKINLRDKTTGWSRYQYSTVFEYEKKRFSCLNGQNLFMKLFVGDYINRESCSNCSFKGFNRKSDITLGDFWGIWDIIPEMDDNKGTSLVILNSEKGNDIWKKISGNIVMRDVTLKEAVSQNASLVVASPAKENRNTILKLATQGKYDEVEKMFLNQSKEKLGFITRANRKIWKKIRIVKCAKGRLEECSKNVLWSIINYVDKIRLKNNRFSILCSNCVGGVLYKRLNEPFLTPTINMWMEDADLIKFASNIKKYVKAELQFIETVYDYPVAKLDDIILYFNHCMTWEEAREHWKKRINRIHEENLFLILSDRCGLTKENIELLESIPCKGKVVFTSQKTELKDYMLFLPYYDGCEKVGIYMLDRLKNKFEIAPFDGYFDYVHFFNTGKVKEYKSLEGKILRKFGRRKYEK